MHRKMITRKRERKREETLIGKHIWKPKGSITTRNHERRRSATSSTREPSLSLSELKTSVLTDRSEFSGMVAVWKGLPGKTLKLMLVPYPTVPSSYIFRAASYSNFSCSACARKGCDGPCQTTPRSESEIEGG